ncbi:MAG: adenylyltransferase/cytidyltransferase family protein [Myxococcales bacterium]|nr:adenylyltransferase/cytidyltransferase family protein [Myxococcales bacterium]
MGTTVYVIGVFDLFHRGHLEFLEASRSLGDRLVVAINGDEMVSTYKRRPVNDETDRLAIVSALRCVDRAFVIEEYDNRQELIRHGVDIIVHGNDWQPDSYMNQIKVDSDFLERHRIRLQFIPYYPGVSTSSIIRAIQESP